MDEENKPETPQEADDMRPPKSFWRRAVSPLGVAKLAWGSAVGFALSFAVAGFLSPSDLSALASLIFGGLSIILMVVGFLYGMVGLFFFATSLDKKRAGNGAKLSALLGVLWFLFISIALPSLLRGEPPRYEANAPGAMRTISTAEVSFQAAKLVDRDGDGVGDYGTLAELANPDGKGETPPFIDAVLGTGTKHGYIFKVNVTYGTATQKPAHTCTADPQKPGKTGIRRYFVDESGVIRCTNDGSPATADSPPLN